MFGVNLTDAAIGAAIFAVVIFKWPQVAVWTNNKCAQAWAAFQVWRETRKGRK